MHLLSRQAIDVAKQCTVLCKENRALLAENERLEGLVELAMDTNDRNNGVVRQYPLNLIKESRPWTRIWRSPWTNVA